MMLAYLICAVITFLQAYISNNFFNMPINPYLFIFLFSLIGVPIAILFHHRNMSFKILSSQKKSEKYKKDIFADMISVLFVFVVYLVIIYNGQHIYKMKNALMSYFNIVEGGVFEIAFAIMLPPDMIIVSCMIGMFLVYSLTRYIFDKSILA